MKTRTLKSQKDLVAKAQFALLWIMAAGVVAFYFAGYRPQTGRLAQLITLTAAHQQELIDNQSKASARNEIAARNEKLRAELDEIKKPSKKKELSDLYKQLTIFGQQESLKRFEFKPGVPTQSELFCEMPLQLSFEGDYLSVFNFLRSTEDMQRLTRVRSLTLKSKPEKPGQVTAQVAVNVYYSAE